MKSTRVTTARIMLAVVVLLWITAYAWLLFQGRYQAFLRAEFRFLIIAGLGMMALLLVPVLWTRDTGGCAHAAQGKSAWTRAALMLLPLVYLGAAQGQSLGAYAFKKRTLSQNLRTLAASGEALSEPARGTRQDPAAEDAVQPPGNAAGDDSDPDIVTLAELYKYPERFDGRRITTVGVLLQDPEFVPPGHVLVFRFMMVCCAADVRTFEILVALRTPPALENDTWVEVQGTLSFRALGGVDMGVVQDATIRKTTQPKIQYLNY